MSLWRQVTRGLRVLTDRTAADQKVSDEVEHYLDEATAAGVARGLPPEEARRAARLELGNATAVREQVRNSGWEMAVETALADLRYAARRLRRSPGFTLVCVLTLALGIGASTAIFSVVNPILFQSLPYPQAGRVTMISDFGRGGAPENVTFGTYLELSQRSRSFEGMAAFRPWRPALAGGSEPERLPGQQVGAGYFGVLGVPPLLGRDFLPSDDQVNGPRVVIISDALWRRRLGADPAVLGRPIQLGGDSYLIIGVMPAGFDNVLAPAADIWAPLQFSTSFGPDSREWGHQLQLVGRLRPGVAIDRARAELEGIARAPSPDFPRVPWASLDQGLIVHSLQDDVTRGVRPALLAVLGAVLLLLIIACVNVTNLLLARGAERQGELAMRTALGAGRGRLVRQLLTESVLLALLGGALGVVVAVFGVRALVALSPPGLPRIDAIAVDGPVLAFGLGLTALVGLAFGLFPALHAARSELHGDLRESSRRTTGGPRTTRGALVITEVALALMLLVSAGLLVRSLERLFAAPLGFDPAGLLTLQVQEAGHQFDSDSARFRFFAQALEAVRQLPGVAGAAWTSQLPLSGDIDVYGTHFEEDRDHSTDDGALRYAVTSEYREVMRIPLRRGRWLDAHDVIGAPRAVVINETLADRKFLGRDPLGQRLRIGPDEGDWYTVVGVVGDVKQSSLAVSEGDAVYIPTTQWHSADNVLSLVVRANIDAAALAPAIQRAIWSVDKDQPITRVATMAALVERSEADRRFASILFELFGVVALILATVGIYGVLSGGVTERTREIGVRSALGASRGSIIALVVRQGMTLTFWGAAVGVAGAIGASRAITALLFGVSRLDPVTYLGVIVLLMGASAVACWLPAWRAARVDPAITLRAE